MEPKYIYIVQGDTYPEGYSCYISVYFASFDVVSAQKQLNALKKKYKSACLQIDKIPLDVKCNVFLGGYSE